ncbi:MAG: radical SAM protein [Kofleriaceae bacterium]|nr:radical SAM protein [Myxococcales bacterium]MCB9562222.1 radical SAM protein [Kofleriaceae bacterium]
MALTIAMVVPPSVNLNTPYAAAPRLAGWLRHLGHTVVPIDVSLELFLRVFSRDGLDRMFAAVDPAALTLDQAVVYRNRDQYLKIIDDAIAVVQLRDLAATTRIVQGGMIPLGPRGQRSVAAPGTWGTTDFARYRVSLMLLELMEFFKATVNPHFGLTDYAASLAASPSSFDPVAAELARPPDAYVTMLEEVAAALVPADLDLVCITCPFPGNLVGALRLGAWLGAHRPGVARALGGGFPSTELRELAEPRVFDHVDYVVLDDGELPLRQLCARLEGHDAPLHNTFTRDAGRVVFAGATQPALPFGDLPPPSYAGFAMRRYVHMVYVSSPVQRANDGPWLKLTAAHGCYWKQCTFCDITLPYIADYDPMPASRLADQMDALHAETGLSGFHFTDEAAPPALLVELALELLRRGRNYHWWGNVRFDRAFEPDRCRLLAAAGMILVTGGIEIASDAVLAKIVKGVSVVQVIKVLQALAAAGIAAHAYLIYGFPGETVQDTINGLEIIRQLVAAGLLDNAVYHQLSVTAHAPLGRTPELFPIRLREQPFGGFARNFLPFAYTDGVPRSRAVHEALGLALDNFRRRLHLDAPVQEWFTGLDVPAPTVAPDFVAQTMAGPHPGARDRDRLCWLGGEPTWSRGLVTVRASSGETCTIAAPRAAADNLRRCHPSHWPDGRPPSRRDLEPAGWFEPFRAHGLVRV